MKWYYNALGYLQVRGFCTSLDQITQPVRGEWYYVRKKDVTLQYRWEGEWVYIGDIKDDDLK